MTTNPSPAHPDGTSTPPVNLHIEFTGGLESLFHNKRKHVISLPSSAAGPPASTDLAHVIAYLATQTSTGTNLSLFIDPECLEGSGSDWIVRKGAEVTVRPGILVLVNDADWELEGGIEATVEDGDEVVFVSTLHGG